MNRNLLYLLSIMLFSIIGTNVSAYDIKVPNADGIMVYYNYVNDGTELAVTAGNLDSSGYSSDYSGTVVIPEEVTINGRTLKVTSIENYSFFYSIELTSIFIGDNVTTIGKGAFKGCVGLTSIAIGNSVTTIGEEAFKQCHSLTSVTIPNGVTSIGDAAFCDCQSLVLVSMDNSVTMIGDFAFGECHKLASAAIPDNAKTIGEGAFYNCFNLTSAIIPDSVTSIGGSAFYNCESLAYVSIGSSVKHIGDDAFYGCRIKIVELNSNEIVSKNYSDGVSICNHFSHLVGTYIVGEGVNSIGDFAFSGFSDGTQDMTLDICSTVSSIGKSILDYHSCKLDLICRATVIPETDEDAFNRVNFSQSTLYVPEASLEAYRTTAPWSEFKNIVPIISSGIIAPTTTQQTIIVECYDLTGHRACLPQRGVNILKMSDGTTKKVVGK